MLTLPLLLLALLATSSALAPLEPPSGVLFGAWLDTTNEGDTPVKFNQRLGFQASLFQFSIELPIQPQSLPPVNLVDATNSDATLYITVFPQFDASYTATEVFDQLTTPVIGELVSLLNGYVSGGRNCIVRIASEMNGSWDAYTQRPTRYIAMWKTIVDAIRAGIPTSSAGKVAFLWSPSSGNGYPSPGGQYSPFSPNVKPYTNLTALYPDDFKLMDTNHDGVLSTLDDPYSPYYPGDDYVDWVGLSLYYFGTSYPWVKNVLPTPAFFLSTLQGKNDGANITACHVDFYEVYSGANSTHKKPMMISETAAAFHEQLIGPPITPIASGPGELALKQAFWRQYTTNSTFFKTFPNIKGLCLFEWAKDEEDTFRDYRHTWNATILSAFKSDFSSVGSSGNTSIYLAATAQTVTTNPGYASGGSAFGVGSALLGFLGLCLLRQVISSF